MGTSVVIVVIVFPAEIRVAVSVAHLVATEVLIKIGAMMFIPVLAAMRIFAVPSIMTVEAIVDMSPEAFAPVIPGSRTYEDAAGKPFGTIISVGRAIIRGIVEIAVRTLRRWSDLYRDLRLCFFG